MAETLKPFGNLRAFTPLILIYFMIQISGSIYLIVFASYGPFAPITRDLSVINSLYLGIIANILLLISAGLLFSLAKLNMAKSGRIKIGATLLIVLGIFDIFIELLFNYFSSSFAASGFSPLPIMISLSVVSLTLSAVTFLIVGISILSRRVRPLIYLATLVQFLLVAILLVGLVGILLGILYTAPISTVLLDIQINGGWLPPVLYIIAFLNISSELKAGDLPVQEEPSRQKKTDNEKVIVVEK